MAAETTDRYVELIPGETVASERVTRRGKALKVPLVKVMSGVSGIDAEDLGAAIPGSPGDCHAPAANAAAVVAYSGAGSGHAHAVSGLCWSYSDTPTGGNLKIQDGSTTTFTMDITTAGAGFIAFPRPKRGSAGITMTITLAAGGDGVVGKLSVLNHWVE